MDKERESNQIESDPGNNSDSERFFDVIGPNSANLKEVELGGNGRDDGDILG